MSGSTSNELTRNYDILVMAHEVLQDGKRCRLHVHISPVYPGMIRPQSSTKKPVTRLGHQLSSARLRSKPVTALHILVDLLSKVFLDDRYLAVVRILVFRRLDSFEVLDQYFQGPILRIGDEESKIDEVVGVCKVAQVREEHREMGFGVSEWHAQ